MTKSTITREQAQKIIVAADEVITALAGTNEDVHPDDSKKMCELWDDLNDRYAPPVVVRELARMALAAMDSEPVAYIIQDRYEREGGVEGHLSRSHVSKYVSQEDINEHEIICTPLFKAPSLTHSIPDEWTFQNTQRYREDTGRQDAWPAMWGWNACRAAMLQAGNSPAQSDCYPAQNHVSPAQNHVSPAQNGGYPAQNQGWIPVSERMPEREVDVQVYCSDKKEQMVGYLERNEQDGYFRYATWRTGDGIYCQPTHWMPLPAAPQEVKGDD
ncbi:DUF551 domain-containing protein [Klebsiella aerogenes]